MFLVLILICYFFFFFFSSRRRHTRLQGDWSSDVCSSDLKRFGSGGAALKAGIDPISVNTQCHDITVYPSLGLAGGACEGHGLLLDIHDVTNPKRLDAVADSNFSYLDRKSGV